MEEYLNQLNEKERIAHQIAIRLLESSYNLEKSNGYLDFIKKK
jgi:predicted adenine nucleotide alpha hydrolase (AANH) superfamily ATPase